MSDLDTFRGETRAWLEANGPAEMREPVRDESDACWGGRSFQFKNEAQKVWLERMAARGWTVPDWPVEYGGGGLSPGETKVLRQELARMGARIMPASPGFYHRPQTIQELVDHLCFRILDQFDVPHSRKTQWTGDEVSEI